MLPVDIMAKTQPPKSKKRHNGESTFLMSQFSTKPNENQLKSTSNLKLIDSNGRKDMREMLNWDTETKKDRATDAAAAAPIEFKEEEDKHVKITTTKEKSIIVKD